MSDQTTDTNKNNKIELISFKLCPFVQRAVIALNEKSVDFKLTHIDLMNTPDWFGDVSPLGKVPVLVVDGTPVFESAVISEYLDEVYEPQLHPHNALEKATHRSWIEFASELIMTQYKMITAESEDDFEGHRASLTKAFSRLEAVLSEKGPYFSGSQFALVDTAFAPIFMRLAILDKVVGDGAVGVGVTGGLNILKSDSVTARWAAALLERESVKTSVIEGFEDLFVSRFTQQGGFVFGDGGSA